MKHLIVSLAAIMLCILGVQAAAPSGTLPVMYITTQNNAPITTKTDYVKGTYYLDPKGVAGVEAFGSADAQLDLQIRGRGNYTWTGFDKKPYRLKLGKKAALMGMPKSKHWALLAHADDNQGFLRNAVGFQLSRIIGLPWTPGDVPVEVVLNGDYIGLYFLTETVRVDSNRVNVWDYDSEYEDYEEANPGQTLPWQDEYATGGWLCEIDNYDDEDQIQIQSQDHYVIDNTLRITYDTPSDYITDAHKTWLRNEITTLDDLIVNGDRNECKWADKVDLTNLAKFFVVNQILFNYESFHGSCKLSRDKGYDTKWNFGPVWDFGSAFQPSANPSGYFYDFGDYSNHWIKTMMEYPAFKQEVQKVYKELMDNGDFDSIYEYIDTFAAKITSAAASDKERWPQYGNDNISGKASNIKNTLRTGVSNCNNLFNYNGGSGDDDDFPADIYLRGEINEWKAEPDYHFTKGNNGVYTLTLAKLSGEFKLGDANWKDVNFGNGTEIYLDTPVVLSYQGDNCNITDELENVTLKFVWDTKTLTVSKSQGPQPGDEVTILFTDNGATPWDNVYIFTFNEMLNGEWPGHPMTRVEPEAAYPRAYSNTWKYVFTSATGKPVHNQTGLVFNDGVLNPTDDKSNHQTKDITYVEGMAYNREGATTGSVNIAIDENDTLEYYTIQGVRVASPEAPGIYIERRGNTTRKIVVR